MRKITQKDLLNEGFWDRFSTPTTRQAWEAIKQVGNVVAPEIAQPLKNIVDKSRSMSAAIREAGKPMQERMANWILEQGKFMLKTPKDLGKYPDGKTHYAVEISEKGVHKDTNQEVAGRAYRAPYAVISYDPSSKKFDWVNKPRSDSYVKYRKSDGNEYYKYINQDADGADEPINYVQQQPQQQPQRPRNFQSRTP